MGRRDGRGGDGRERGRRVEEGMGEGKGGGRRRVKEGECEEKQGKSGRGRERGERG